MNDRSFHLEINNFDDFVQFVAIIRGEDIDSNKLKELRDKLSAERTKLDASIKEEQNG